MRLHFLLVAAMALAVPAAAQDPVARPAGAEKPPAEDAGVEDAVSLERIREKLNKQGESQLRQLDARADFTVHIEEQARIDRMMSKLDFSSGPAPAGGLYAYEQQQRLFNRTARPLQQPYAAFSGGELVTIALENLIARYLGGAALSALSAAERGRAESEAQREVDRAVSEYCAGRSDRDYIQLCTSPPER